MAKQITIDEPVLVDGVTGDMALITAKLNNKNIGLPIITSTANSVELIQPTVNMRLHNSTLYTMDEGKAYTSPNGKPLGIGVRIGHHLYALPIYTVPQNTLDTITINFNETTFVTDMKPCSKDGNSTKNLIISINDINYALPLFDFDTLINIQTGETKEMPDKKKDLFHEEQPQEPTVMDHESNDPDVKRHLPRPPEKLIKTMISIGKPTVDFGSDYGSTYLNNKITAYSDLINRIKMQFGWPSVEIDLCDENIAEFIDQAMELYSKYAGFTEEFLIFDTKLYKRGIGIRLDKLFSISPELYSKAQEGNKIDFDYDIQNYRKVLNVSSVNPGESTGVNTLFTLEQAMAQQTYFSYLLGSYGFDLITWNCVKNWLDLREKVLAQTPYFRFNPQTQYLRIIPEPLPHQNYLGLVSCYVEKPIRELINEPWIFEYSMALTLVAIGRLRSKYSFQMLGGATITGDQVLSQGMEKKKELEEMLFKGQGWVGGEYAQPMFFIG